MSEKREKETTVTVARMRLRHARNLLEIAAERIEMSEAYKTKPITLVAAVADIRSAMKALDAQDTAPAVASKPFHEHLNADDLEIMAEDRDS